jgi:hypothetical protein
MDFRNIKSPSFLEEDAPMIENNVLEESEVNISLTNGMKNGNKLIESLN